MSSSIASSAKILALAVLALAQAPRGESAMWTASFVTEPKFLVGIFHPAVQGAFKLDHGNGLRTQARLSMASEVFGLFEPRREPRAWDVTGGLLVGAVLPFWKSRVEVSAGPGAVLSRGRGELQYRHEWGGGLFPERTSEYRERLYAVFAVPYHVQWQFGRDMEGAGLEYSGYFSGESSRWGIGFFWQYHLGPPPPPLPEPVRKPVRKAPDPQYEPGGEELEE